MATAQPLRHTARLRTQPQLRSRSRRRRFSPAASLVDVGSGAPLSSVETLAAATTAAVAAFATSEAAATIANALPDNILSAAQSFKDVEADTGWARYTGMKPGGDAAAAAAVLGYLFTTPGIASGFVDEYVLRPLDKLRQSVLFRGEDVELGRVFSTGGFGSVYEGTLRGKERVVVKRAKRGLWRADELSRVEVLMNQRIRRAPALRAVCAEFLGDYEAKEDGSTCLVFADAGRTTLEDMLASKQFLRDAEMLAFGSSRSGSEIVRSDRCVRALFRQVLQAVATCHAHAIVHRDIKPANLLFATRRRGDTNNTMIKGRRAPLKLIDFGAATDLRVGLNFVPGEGILDENYAPPEQLVLPESTPRAPPAPVAAALSPLLWFGLRPDLYDSYSTGLLLLRLAVPELRREKALSQSGDFQRGLTASGYDLRRWRREFGEQGKGLDFTLLDANNGLGFDLAARLVAPRNRLRRGRLSPAAALLHPYMLLPTL